MSLGNAPSQRERRRSSLADTFGSGAAQNNRRNSRGSVGRNGPTLCRSDSASPQKQKPAEPPLFIFRHHTLIRDAVAIREELRDAPPAQTSDHVAEHRKEQFERRKSMVNEVMCEESLGHLMIESRKDKLLLPTDPPSNTGSDERFVAFSEDVSVLDNDADKLWARVASEKRRQAQELRLREKASQNPLEPNWWKRLSLRDFSNFLTPGLFSVAELEANSEPDEPTDDIDGSFKTTVSTNTKFRPESLEVLTAQSGDPFTAVAPDRGTKEGFAVPPDNSKSSAVFTFAAASHPLDIRLQNVAAWTQHISSRPPTHWLTPRRHGVHHGKSIAEIGMLTTTCTRDFVAACNSCLGVCQAEERVARLVVERDHRSGLALLFQAFVYGCKRATPASADALLLLSVAENDEREDIAEEEAMQLDWMVAIEVLLPSEVSAGETERLAATKALIEVLRLRAERRSKAFSVADVMDDTGRDKQQSRNFDPISDLPLWLYTEKLLVADSTVAL